jgi:hypothetical protein
MPTVSKYPREIIQNDGYYSDDPRVIAVIRYDAFGHFAYGLVYENDRCPVFSLIDYLSHRKACLIWHAKDVIDIQYLTSSA